MSGCNAGNLCINVNATQSRQVESKMDFQNYLDRTILRSVNRGDNCISWDAYDANNIYVSDTDSVIVTLKYTTGITHLPLIDVENHQNGYNLSLIRPTKQADGSALPELNVLE